MSYFSDKLKALSAKEYEAMADPCTVKMNGVTLGTIEAIIDPEYDVEKELAVQGIGQTSIGQPSTHGGGGTRLDYYAISIKSPKFNTDKVIRPLQVLTFGSGADIQSYTIVTWPKLVGSDWRLIASRNKTI